MGMEISMEDVIHESYDKLVKQGKFLVSKGYTALPCDEPKQLKIGYLFEDEKHDVVVLSMRIADLKKTAPEEVREKYFRSERGRLNFTKDRRLKWKYNLTQKI